MLQETYRIRFNKELAAIHRLHEIKVKVAAEYLRPQPRHYSPVSQQLKKGPCDNNKKEIRTRVIKTLERTEITNKDNVQAEMTLTTLDRTVLGTADPARSEEHTSELQSLV